MLATLVNAFILKRKLISSATRASLKFCTATLRSCTLLRTYAGTTACGTLVSIHYMCSACRAGKKIKYRCNGQPVCSLCCGYPYDERSHIKFSTCAGVLRIVCGQSFLCQATRPALCASSTSLAAVHPDLVIRTKSLDTLIFHLRLE